MKKVLALTNDGRLTYCTAPPERRGIGRCNHKAHQETGEPREDFVNRISESFGANKSEAEDVAKVVTFGDVKDKCELAKQGKALNMLINDADSEVRAEVAKQKYGLETLVKDPSWYVRREVARQGYGLEELVKDSDAEVLKEVARQGYGLDVLAKDKDSYVRAEVAKQGWNLKELAKDPAWNVNVAVIDQGVGLNKFIADEDATVRDAAQAKLEDLGYASVEDWAKDHPNDVVPLV